jgi:hypothetical protein
MWQDHIWPYLLLTVILCATALAQSTHQLSFRASGTQFDVTVPDKELAASDQELQTYISQGASAVATYFGRFPLPHVNINLRAVAGDSVRFGRSSPMNGGTIMMMVGRDANADAFESDWTLTHEMVHLAFPATKGDNHEWLGEGMATYVEPIARAQAGLISDREVWRQFVDYMSRGLPRPNDPGIDEARGVGRVYWGGALFCLMADLQIRKETHNRKGLQDAFRAIMHDGGSMDGTMEYEWNIETIFETGDKATGTHVLQNLYREWKNGPAEVNLSALWKQLGIEKSGDSITFRSNAPFAATRKAITARR